MDVAGLLARHEPDAVALVCDDRSVSWRALSASIGQIAGRLAERTTAGDVVVVLGGTSIEFVQAVLGALAAGNAVLPLHPRSPQAELAHACSLASPRLIIDVDGSDAAAELCDAEVVGIDDVMTGDEGSAVPVDEHAPALLMFTSGTAGSPRIAVLSRANLSASMGSSLRVADDLDELTSVLLGVMPLTHVLGLVSVVGASIVMGGTLVLATDTRVDHIVDLVERHGVTLLIAPPVFWFRLGQHDVEPGRLASVRMGLSGAAPLAGSVAASIADRLGLKLRQGYGLTEASPGLTSSVGTEAPATSVGRPLPGVEIRLVDEFGDDALVGDVGEVLARGANVFQGYLGDPQATADVLDADGWLHTGDLAVVDENGYLYIVGRSKDQIICAGFNVHPGEVEDWLATHPSVAAAAVVGQADREYGEIVVAHVVVAEGHETPDVAGLQAHCRTRLAGYKVPRHIEFVDELPRGATGKLRRRALRTEAAG